MAVSAFVHPVSATPVVALAGILVIVAIMSVLLISFMFYRRSGRR